MKLFYDKTLHKNQRITAPLASRCSFSMLPNLASHLQRSIGNTALQSHAQTLQSEDVSLRRACGCHGSCLSCAQGEVEASPQVETLIEAQRGSGQPLSATARAFFEPRFGYDFGSVRIHIGTTADQLNRALHARAFTTQRDIFFRQGEYRPDSSDGKMLLAHELTHVIQQTGGVRTKLTVGQAHDLYEQEADAVAEQVMRMPASETAVQGPQVQKQDDTEEEADMFLQAQRQPRPAPSLTIRRSPVQIRRAVSYTGALVQQDIHPLDPTTAPAGNQRALGHTALLVNGTDVQSLTEAQARIDLLFPLPSVATLSGSCFVTNKNINMTVLNRVRTITPPPWTLTIARSALHTLFGGALGNPRTCSGPGNTTVSVRGAPSDLALRAWVLQSEMQHARDDACLIDRYVKSYEADVQALPEQFLRGYLGLGSCTARLEERLRRTERAQAFFRDWRDWGQAYDGGSHTISATARIAAGCNTVTLTVNTGPLPAQGRNCAAWSPP